MIDYTVILRAVNWLAAVSVSVMKDNLYSLTPLVYLHILAINILALPSGLKKYRYAYILTVHTEEYQKFIIASIIFDVLHPISNNQLEFQLVSPSQEIDTDTAANQWTALNITVWSIIR